MLIVIGCVVIVAVLFLTCFPKVFWIVHNHNTNHLNDTMDVKHGELEYEYGQDLKEEVEEQVTEISEDGTLEYYFVYPKSLKTSTVPYPVVVWGNGTANTYVNYQAGLRSLASYGFIVIGCNDSNMGDGKTLYDMAVYARDLNDEKDSIFYRKIDVDHIGVAGHSQGACGAVNAATRYEESRTLFASLFTTSMPKLEMCVDKKNMMFAYWKYDVSLISTPYFATTGTGFLDSMWISPRTSIQDNFAKLSGTHPAYMARQIGASHNIVNEYHGCGYFNAWFCYTLKADERAGAVFTGETELKQNTKRWKDFNSL